MVAPSGKLAVIGDAAHDMTQYLGLGEASSFPPPCAPTATNLTRLPTHFDGLVNAVECAEEALYKQWIGGAWVPRIGPLLRVYPDIPKVVSGSGSIKISSFPRFFQARDMKIKGYW